MRIRDVCVHGAGRDYHLTREKPDWEFPQHGAMSGSRRVGDGEYLLFQVPNSPAISWKHGSLRQYKGYHDEKKEGTICPQGRKT